MHLNRFMTESIVKSDSDRNSVRFKVLLLTPFKEITHLEKTKQFNTYMWPILLLYLACHWIKKKVHILCLKSVWLAILCVCMVFFWE